MRIRMNVRATKQGDNDRVAVAAIFIVALVSMAFIGVGCGGGGSGGGGSSAPVLPAQVGSPNPISGATDVSATPTLSWAAATGATSYEVYFGATSTGWTAVTNTVLTSFSPSVLSYSTVYYWRINSQNASGATTGIIWSFTTEALPLPAEASSPNPINDATDVQITQTLSWAAATGATSYDVYFGATSTGWTAVTNTVLTSFSPSVLSYSTVYYWRINSQNASGATTGIIWSFTTEALPLPVQASSPNPINDATDVQITQTLSWAAATGATSYDVYFGATSTGWTAVTNTVLTSFSPSVLSYSTVYYWRIDSRNTSGATAGVVWSFTTAAIPLPAQVSSPNPISGTTDVPITQTLSWAAAIGAASYDVYFGDTSTGWTAVTNTVLTSFSPSVLSYSTVYYWRIDSMNASGATAGIIWSFTSEANPLPSQVTSANPANGAISVPVISSLSWDAAVNASSYDVYFSATATPVFIINTTETTYTPTSLSYSTVYYWHIDARNDTGATPGTLWYFSTEILPLPAQVTSPSPDNGTIHIPLGTPLNWGAALNTSSYDVYLGLTPTPVFIQNQTNTTYTPDAEQYSTLYYWRIDARNSTGATTGVVWHFTTVPIPLPAPVTVPNPADGATDIPINPALNWMDAARASSYDVFFGATATPDFVQNQAGTTYSPGAALQYSTLYYWRVDARNDTGPTAGTVWSFTTAAIPVPDQVVPLAPVNDATNIDILPTLSWNTATRALSYDVYFGTTATPDFVQNQPDTTYTPGSALQYSTLYYWRVDARNSTGPTTGVVWSFATATIPVPDQVVPIAPVNDATDIDITPTLSWNATARALSYDVYLDTTSTAWTPITNTVLLSFSPSVLSYSTVYYWRVDAKNNSGPTTGNIWSFTTIESPAPAQVVYDSPANTAADIARLTQLIWEPANKADSYDVYFGVTSEGWSVITNTAMTSYAPALLVYNTTYYWQIDARNTFGVTPGDLWSFTTVVDNPPVLTAPGNKTIDENKVLSFTLSASDVDGDALSYSAAITPSVAGISINAGTGYFTWRPTYTQSGTYQLTLTVSDGYLSDSQTIAVVVNDVPLAPILGNIPAQTEYENQLLTVKISNYAGSLDNAPITFTAQNLPSGASFIEDGTFTWTPTYTQAGDYVVTCTAYADGLSSASKPMAIHINDVNTTPALTSPDNQTITETNTLSFTLSATDADGDTITYSMIATPTLTSATLDPDTGAFSWMPGLGDQGDYTVTFRATDPSGAYDEKTITITVVP